MFDSDGEEEDVSTFGCSNGGVEVIDKEEDYTAAQCGDSSISYSPDSLVGQHQQVMSYQTLTLTLPQNCTIGDALSCC